MENNAKFGLVIAGLLALIYFLSKKVNVGTQSVSGFSPGAFFTSTSGVVVLTVFGTMAVVAFFIPKPK